MELKKYIETYDAFVFDLDNVIYPEKDFFLQVYYLFAQFIEYGEQQEAGPILSFMQNTYQQQGPDGIFEKTAAQFGIPEKYKLNFDLLHRNIRLPLKLLLFEEVLSFLQAIVVERKPLFLLVSGHPESQLNKIKQTDWKGLEPHLQLYFSEELSTKEGDKGLDHLIETHQLKGKKILVVEKNWSKDYYVFNTDIDFLQVERLFVS
ncbi:HAD family hydrolase [Pedobacter nutrimenti]|jgi:FMN phosphatase YigB (HAD superfamily)|uniref:FMN phosphatase YigB (HAD superfamily) n=1 Tax=Pedobacter nutrimenti TaxID=1241337 RepID=A0A318UAY4_9SPHI|nr:HAD family hydrolase [Pedobacter nutrimenti]PYF72683.1 hypothetical protein B0O44_10552 [Pedobacter nutrimenti]